MSRSDPRSTMEDPAEDVSSLADRIIVTIDGPAGAGKSTIGRALANELGVEFLDTGAMYRAATALALDSGVEPSDGKAVAALASRADIHFDWMTDPPTLLAYMKPYAERLRDKDVAKTVSQVSALPELRDVLVRKQRVIGAQHPRLVTEGRDQGSVVFPDADVKLYLTASPRARAERRSRQYVGKRELGSLDEIEREIIARDQADSTRAVGPLVCPQQARVIDSSDMSFEQVLCAMTTHVRAVMAPRADARA